MAENAELKGLQFRIGAKNEAVETLNAVRSSLRALKTEAQQRITPKLDAAGVTAGIAKIKAAFQGLRGGKVETPVVSLDELKEKLAEAKKLQAQLAAAYRQARSGTDRAYDKDAKLTDYDRRFKTDAYKQAQAGLNEAFETEKQIKSEYENATKSVNDLQAQIKAFKAPEVKDGDFIGKLFSGAKTGLNAVTEAFIQTKALFSTGIKVLTIPEKIAVRIGRAFGSNVVSGVIKATSAVTAFGRRFTHVLSYRAFRRFIGLIYNGLTQGKQNLYKWSDEFGGSFARNMDRIATSALYLKNSIGTLAEPVITVVAPAFERFVDTAVAGISAVAEGLAIITGSDAWTKATKAAKKYGEETGKLAGIDELHIIGNGSGPDPSEMFQTEKVSKELKDLFDAGRYEDFGKEIAKKLNTAVEQLDDWFNHTLRPKGTKWAKIAARIGNGIVDGFHWNVAGKTLADGLNAVADITNTFLTTFRFDRLGSGVMNAVNGFFDGTEWDLLGETLANRLNAVIDFAWGAVRTASPFKYGKDLGEMFTSWVHTIEWARAGETLGQGITKLFQNVSAFFETADVTGFASGLADWLNRAVATTDWHAVGYGLGSFFGAVIGGLITFIDAVEWDALGAGLGEALDQIPWGDYLVSFGTSLGTAFMEVIKGLFDSKTGTVAAYLASAVGGMLAGAKIGSLFGPMGALAGAGIGALAGTALTGGMQAGTAYNKRKIGGHARGGTIPAGELFYAGESGPEYVGTLGGSQTAVANTEQIIEGVKRGVLEAMLQAGSAKDGEKAIHVTVDLDGRKIGEQTVSYINGETRRTGNSPLYSY